MHCEIIKAIRAEIGDDFPVIIKLGIQDGVANGLGAEEGKVAAQIIAEAGYDAIEISQGLQDLSSESWDGTPMRSNINKPEDEAYFRDWAREVKQLISKPIILTGGIRSYEVAEKIIANNDADMLGMCRPFIREPELIKRWQNGDHSKATCISCNKCITELLLNGLPLECYLDKKEK